MEKQINKLIKETLNEVWENRKNILQNEIGRAHV